jgi:soluble lytic murein transglycosylase-like protein
MYFYLDKYSIEFGVPMEIAMGVAYQESRYRGPFHWNYNHAQSSGAGAEGPMQVLLSTAHYINKDNVSREYLRTNIEYNVKTSMKLLRKLYNRYHDWKICFGYYNTGYPRVNDYAIKVFNYKMK